MIFFSKNNHDRSKQRYQTLEQMLEQCVAFCQKKKQYHIVPNSSKIDVNQ